MYTRRIVKMILHSLMSNAISAATLLRHPTISEDVRSWNFDGPGLLMMMNT